uniref:Uncharacterized protein n=1 Tax=Triticum urartu TaxID=4572 RepID=A0A8R7VL41_TRIUA
DEHVGDTAQPPSAQTVQELVDLLSCQVTGRICAKGKSTTGVLVEEKDLVSYRRDWEKTWGDKCGSFEFYSCVRAMLFTCKRTPPHVGVKTCLQIFSIRVMEINGGIILSGNSRSTAWSPPGTPWIIILTLSLDSGGTPANSLNRIHFWR